MKLDDIKDALQSLAQAIADKVNRAWTEVPAKAPAMSHKEMAAEIDLLADEDYVERFAEYAARDILKSPPREFARLPLPHAASLGGLAGEASAGSRVWIRWRLWYDGHEAKNRARIDWCTDHREHALDG